MSLPSHSIPTSHHLNITFLAPLCVFGAVKLMTWIRTKSHQWHWVDATASLANLTWWNGLLQVGETGLPRWFTDCFLELFTWEVISASNIWPGVAFFFWEFDLNQGGTLEACFIFQWFLFSAVSGKVDESSWKIVCLKGRWWQLNLATVLAYARVYSVIEKLY